ncbi:hypothetical protein JCM11251_004953 [Rhodosporidiobolus azoricus]
MSTTTQTALSAPLPVLQHSTSAPVPSSAQKEAGCSHLRTWFSSNPDLALERLTTAARWDCSALVGPSTPKTTPPPPTCATCSSTPLRPFVALGAGEVYCGGMGKGTHAAAQAGREASQLSWDLRSRALFCHGCGDYVRHPAVERLAVEEGMAKMERSTDGERAAKRKRISGVQKAELLNPPESLVVPARGIRNLGNSCYLSVILQTLFSNPFLRSYFLADRHNRLACDKSRQGEACLSCEMDLLFTEQYSPDPTPLAPTRLLHAFWQCSAEAAGYAQQDAHEFLISTLNLIHSSSPSHSPSPDPLAPCPCIIHRTFAGQLRSAVTCGRCGHMSETFEPFLDLSLDVRDRSVGGAATKETVRACLDSFTAPEKLPSKFDCAACGPGSSASKRLSLKTLPHVLCVQLKRFEHTVQATKIDAPVRYPLKLDMSPYLSANIDYPAAAKSNPANATSKYHLTAVVAHEGTLSQGHYTAYIRGADDFFAVDDDKVRRVGILEVLAAKAYLVVYSRV